MPMWAIPGIGGGSKEKQRTGDYLLIEGGGVIIGKNMLGNEGRDKVGKGYRELYRSRQ